MRYLSPLAAAIVLTACSLASQPWTLTVENGAGAPVRIRVETAKGVTDWVVPPLATEVILREDVPTAGTVHIVDPTTCAIMATAPFESARGLLVLVDRGANDDGPWDVSLVEESTQARAIEPIHDACAPE